MKYYYYEEGKTQTFTETELQNYFDNTAVLDEQKRQGTTYETWKSEMIHMQILCPVTETEAQDYVSNLIRKEK